MAGHGLLPGCQRAWNHDECPGYQPATKGNSFNGVVCHCPCHRLRQTVADLEERLGRVHDAEAGGWAEGYADGLAVPHDADGREPGHPHYRHGHGAQWDDLDPRQHCVGERPPTAPGGPPAADG